MACGGCAKRRAEREAARAAKIERQQQALAASAQKQPAQDASNQGK